MQFQPFEPDIEVFGPSIDAILEGFTLFPTLALEKLAHRGIGDVCEDENGQAPTSSSIAIAGTRSPTG